MITEGNQPANANTNSCELFNGEILIIAILFCVIITLAIILIIKSNKYYKKIEELQKHFKNDITNEEAELLLTYRTLNDRDKIVIKNTIKTFTENNEHKKE